MKKRIILLLFLLLGPIFLLSKNVSAANLSTSSFDIRGYNTTYEGISHSGWYWQTGILYGSYNSHYVNLTRTNAWQWNSASVTPTNNTATIHFETNIVFNAWSRNYINFQNLQNFYMTANSSVGSISLKSYSISYALTDWTCQNNAPCTTLTIYGDVVLSNVTPNQAQVFTIQLLNNNTFFYTDNQNANTANVWFEQNPATISYTSDLSETLLQTQINQNATIIYQNGQLINRQEVTTDAVNNMSTNVQNKIQAQSTQQHSDSQAEQQKLDNISSKIQDQTNKDTQDRSNINNQQSDIDEDSENSSEDIEDATSNISGIVSTFLGNLNNLRTGSCSLPEISAYGFSLGQLNLCTYSPPSWIQNIATAVISLMMLGLAIHLFRRIMRIAKGLAGSK